MRLPKLLIVCTLSLALLEAGAIAAPPVLVSQQFSWGQIFARLRRRKPPFISRGDGLCALSPADNETIALLTNPRPTLMWQGNPYKIAIRISGTTKHLWDRKISEIAEDIERVRLKNKRIINRYEYRDQPLQVGQTYEFLLYFGESDKTPLVTTFQILPPSKQGRSEISDRRSEARILQQVQALTESGLWSDAIVAAYSVKNPSSELMKVQQEIPGKVCEEPE